MGRALLSILLTVFMFASSPGQTVNGQRGGITYNTYSNARFKYSIAYPAGILYPQGEADNGDGQKFLSKDGRAQMLVYGGYQLDAVDLRQMYEASLEQKAENGASRKVTMKVLRKYWFVISGYAGEKVFYQKTMLKGGTFKTFIIEYDRAQKSFYDPVTARIARSFVG